MDFWTKHRILEQCVDALFEKTLYICSSDGGASKHLILSCFVRDITRVDIITFATKLHLLIPTLLKKSKIMSKKYIMEFYPTPMFQTLLFSIPKLISPNSNILKLAKFT